MNFLVPKATLEAILQYLGQQPYVGVANLIQAIGQCVLDPKDVKAGEAELAKKNEALKEKVATAVNKANKKVTPIKKNVKKGDKKNGKAT